jgi:hypothetical protein
MSSYNSRLSIFQEWAWVKTQGYEGCGKWALESHLNGAHPRSLERRQKGAFYLAMAGQTF